MTASSTNDAGGDGKLDVADALRRLRAGEEDAYRQVVERFAPELYAIALRSVGSPEAADEIVQACFVRAYQRLAELKDDSSFPGWLHSIVYSRISDYYRKKGREKKAIEKMTEVRRLAERSDSDPPTALERQELSRLLAWAVAQVDEKHREVFIMREVEGMPHEEIARLLGIPLGTVWSRLSHAKLKLRSLLSGRGGQYE